MSDKRAMEVMIHSKRRVFDGFFKIDEAELSFTRYDGTVAGPVTRLCFERGDSAAAIIYNRDSRRVILVEQFKYPTYANGPGWIMETVAGVVEPGETPETAIRREVLEEIGYELEALEELATFYVSPGGSSERIILFYGEVTAAGRIGPGGGVDSEAEDIRLIELSRAQLSELIHRAQIQDAKTLIAAQWLERHLSQQES